MDRTFGLEMKIFDLLRARHQLGVDVVLATSPRDEMAVLQANGSAMAVGAEGPSQPESRSRG